MPDSLIDKTFETKGEPSIVLNLHHKNIFIPETLDPSLHKSELQQVILVSTSSTSTAAGLHQLIPGLLPTHPLLITAVEPLFMLLACI